MSDPSDPRDRAPGEQPILEYRRPDPALWIGPPKALQLTVGAAIGVEWAATVVGIVYFSSGDSRLCWGYFLISGALLTAFSSHMRHRRSWLMFIPGVFIGIAMGILLACGVCGYMVSHFH